MCFSGGSPRWSTLSIAGSESARRLRPPTQQQHKPTINNTTGIDNKNNATKTFLKKKEENDDYGDEKQKMNRDLYIYSVLLYNCFCLELNSFNISFFMFILLYLARVLSPPLSSSTHFQHVFFFSDHSHLKKGKKSTNGVSVCVRARVCAKNKCPVL